MSEKRFLEIFLFVSILGVKIGLSSQQVILRGITNQEVDLNRTAHFLVQVDDSVNEGGVWRKNGTGVLTNTERISIVDSSGYRELVIYSLETTDAGQYTFTILGESTSALLRINGTIPVGTWSPWGNWSNNGTCPATCGTSATYYKTRTRECNIPIGGKDCPGPRVNNSEPINCGQTPCPIDGGWSTWTRWSTVICPVPCESGQGPRTKYRYCNKPSPSYGGEPCVGNNSTTEQAPCLNLFSCQGIWDEWSAWSTSSCSVTCGTGMRTRRRNRSCRGGSSCPGNAEESNTQECSLNTCEGIWDEWSAWSTSSCSVTCGKGVITGRRNRTCQGGNSCFGNAEESRTQECSQTCGDEIWGVWSAWSTSSCSVTCGKGEITSSRNRTCQGGGSCPGNATESDMQECSLKNCAITAPVKSTNDEINWLIAAIGAVIVIGIALLILIIVCFICQCREKKPKAPTSVGTASWDLDERNEYLTRAKYNDPKLNGSEYTSTMIQ